MTILGVASETTTLQDAQRILGKAEIRHNGGDAAASASAACYVGPDGTTLALVSNSEMGGGTAITDVQLVARGVQPDYSGLDQYVVPQELRPRCASLKALSRATGTPGGLRLGMSRTEVLRLLGRPAQDGERNLMFMAESKVPSGATAGQQGRGAVPVRLRSIRIALDRGRVVAIQVSQGTGVT